MLAYRNLRLPEKLLCLSTLKVYGSEIEYKVRVCSFSGRYSQIPVGLQSPGPTNSRLLQAICRARLLAFPIIMICERERTMDIKQLSSDLMEAQEEYGQQLDELYDRLANRESMDEEARKNLKEEVEARLDTLSVSASCTRKALQRAVRDRDELVTRYNEVERSTRAGRVLPVAPSNTEIDYQEETKQHFAQGLNFYKIFWILFMGSFLGVVVELLYCYATHGYFESRSGLVYGPFNLLYGIGAVVLSLTLYKYRNRDSVICFLGGMIVGSTVEYVCSWAQEMLFGTRSWDYSNLPLNLNGRICFMYSIFWGILGVLWIKKLYPFMADLLLHIPDRAGRVATWLLLAFLVFDGVMTTGACLRWNQRNKAVEADSRVEQFFDEHFPNERMKEIFINANFQ